MTFARAIATMRLYHGLRQREVCDRIGMSTSMMSQIEKGTRNPTLPTLDRISALYEIPTSMLAYVAEAIALPPGTPRRPYPHPLVAKMIYMHRAMDTMRRDRPATKTMEKE